MKTRYVAFLAVTALMLADVGCNSKQESSANPGLEEAVSTATEAYIYGYPLVTMDVTRRKITNVAEPDRDEWSDGSNRQSEDVSTSGLS